MATARNILRETIRNLSQQIFDIKQRVNSSESTHIQPSSPLWHRYISLKKQVSLHLTALAILKFGNDELPSLNAIKKHKPNTKCPLCQGATYKRSNLLAHAKHGKGKYLLVKAYKLLRRLIDKEEKSEKQVAMARKA